MLPKHCAHCRHVFIPRGIDLSQVFCHTCVRLCDDVYARIRRYLQDNPSASAVQITVNLGIPAIIAHHVFRKARFTQDLSKRVKSQEKRQCTVCRQLLKPHEDVYCTPCNKVVEKRMHTQYNRVSAQQETSSESGSRRSTTDKSRHHYGFGRSF